MKILWIGFLVVLLGILSGCVGLTPKPIFTPDAGDVSSKPEKIGQRDNSATRSRPQPKRQISNLPSNRTKATTGLSLESREKIMQQVEKYLGVPYRWGGMNNSGMDCSGFVVVVFRDALGIVLPHSTSKLLDQCEPIMPEDLDFGDLVFFRDKGWRQLLHVGIFLGGTRFAHASTSKGVTISSLQDDYYRSRFLGARRILNLVRNEH